MKQVYIIRMRSALKRKIPPLEFENAGVRAFIATDNLEELLNRIQEVEREIIDFFLKVRFCDSHVLGGYFSARDNEKIFKSKEFSEWVKDIKEKYIFKIGIRDVPDPSHIYSKESVAISQALVKILTDEGVGFHVPKQGNVEEQN